MRAYLVKQDVWGIVSGAEAKPLRSSRSKPMKAWTQKRDIVAAEILLHVSKKYIAHCDDEDPAGTWEHLQILFHAQGQSTIATLHCEFHSVMKTGDESMHEWITQVETLVYQLKALNSPLDDIDVINSLTCGIGNDYAPLIMHFNSLLADPTTPDPNQNTVPYVIQQLIGEEMRLKTTIMDNVYAGTQMRHVLIHVSIVVRKDILGANMT